MKRTGQNLWSLQSFNILCQITKFNRVYMAGGQGIFFHTNPLNISEMWTAAKLYISNATDLKLGSSTYFSLLFPFLVFTKCQVLHLRVGRSRDPLLQKAYCPIDTLHVCGNAANLEYRTIRFFLQKQKFLLFCPPDWLHSHRHASGLYLNVP